MNNFAAGDRCLVHRLESEAGQLLNGQHVTLVKAIIQNGRFRGKFDDGTFKQIKPCNLQIIKGDRINQTKEKREESTSSNPNKNGDQIKKEVTTINNDDKKETASPPPPTEKEKCSICLDFLPMDASTLMRAVCCGKGMHKKCRENMLSSNMNEESANRCVMCRTKYLADTKEGKKIEIKQLRKWVKKGKAWAQLMLGCRYTKGKGVEKDEKRAEALYNLAAEQGNAVAQFNLGVMYEHGQGVGKDEKHAVELYTLAAGQGHFGAQYNLGAMYERGRGVDKDEKRAVELYSLAADQGIADAQYNLGIMYEHGQGVDKDEKRAIEFNMLAADQGHPNAQYNLGVMYRDGQGVDKDEKRAVEIFTLAADQGYAKAQYNLGCMFANGQGINQSFAEAKKWFTQAALQGHEDAIGALKQLDAIEGRITTTSSTVCSYCNKPEPTTTKFKKCKRCHSVAYCNRECQTKHWTVKPNGHRKQCKKLAAAFKNKKNAK